MPEFDWMQTFSRWRVRSSLAALIIVVILARPTPAFLLGGIAFTLIGLMIRTWASGHLIKEKQLAVTGPYQYTRNPLYLGNLILGAGVVVGSHSWWVLGIFVAYFILFYPAVIKKERDRMKELFSDRYEDYKKNVPLFFPSFMRFRSHSGKSRFNWDLYKKNKEYRAQLGAFVFWLIMAGKMLLFP